MTRALALVGLVLTASLAATDVAAAPAKTDLLAREIKAHCVTPDGGGPLQISAADLWTAIDAAGLGGFKIEPAWRMSTASLSVNVGRAVAAKGGEAGKDNREIFYNLERIFAVWIDSTQSDAGDWLPFEEGGVAIRTASGAAVPLQQLGQVATLAYAGSSPPGTPAPYVFLCKVPAPPPAEPVLPVKERTHIVIAKTPQDLGKALGKKAFAELAYIDDIDKGEESYSIAATVGLAIPAFEFKNYRDGVDPPIYRALVGRFEPYAQIVRQGSDKAGSASVNNLDFGFNLAGQYHVSNYAKKYAAVHYYALTFKYLTDDDFNSDVLAAQLYVEPDLPLPGYWTPALIWSRPEHWELRADWSGAVVADVMSVQDVGDKVMLKDAAEYTRVGYDLSGALRWKPHDGDWNVSLSASYKVRDGLTEDGGDAQLFTAELLLNPSPHFSIGLGYDRGENLETFEFQEIWRMKFGVRY